MKNDEKNNDFQDWKWASVEDIRGELDSTVTKVRPGRGACVPRQSAYSSPPFVSSATSSSFFSSDVPFS
eukprot:5176777-Pyramimonas_sp.AAC.1